MEHQDPTNRTTTTPTARRRPAALVALALLLVALAGACSSGGSASSATTTVDTTASEASVPGVMFVVSAGSGSAVDGQLTLAGVDPWVTVFADRPARSGSRLATSEFVESWTTFGFDEDPPNAAITVVDGGEERTVVAELRSPELDGTGTELRFAYTLAEGQPDLPGSFERPDLFVDNANEPTLTTHLPGPDGGRVEADLMSIATTGVGITTLLAPSPEPEEMGSRYLSAFLLPATVELSAAELDDPSAIRAALGDVVAAHLAGDATAGAQASSDIPSTYGSRSFFLESDLTAGRHTVVVVAATQRGLGGIDATTDAVAVVQFEVGGPS